MKATVAIASLVGIILLAGVPMSATSECTPAPAIPCECINPFQNTTGQAYKGDPDILCGESGPGICYVENNCACSDQAPTASVARKQSALACQVHTGGVLQSLPSQTKLD